MIIAIDGPSGTGKSTVAKGVAKRLGFTFFDTGAMYRTLAWKILKEGVDPSDPEKVVRILPYFKHRIETDKNGERHYFVDDIDVTKEIRSQQISSLASQIAVYPEVRKFLVKIQRKFGYETNAVFEGRDMGTVVFPDADLKIFLTAKPKVRAERRYKELLTKFPDLADTLDFEQILKEIEQRDQADITRTISPLKQAPDAILIDTSYLTADQVIDRVIQSMPCSKKQSRMKLSYFIIYSLARLFFKLCFRLKIYGLEHFRPGAAILASNHTSHYDPPVLSISCPEEVHFLARASLFDVPLLGRLIHILNSHPIERGTSDATTFRLMIQLLQEGNKLIIFPEGSRSPNGELQPLERGLGFLVQKAKCRIIPAYIKGAYEAWPRKQKFPKLFGKMAVAFGTPIEWEEFESLDKKEAQVFITKRAEQAIHQLKEWFDKGAAGHPP
ncbi:MAG TPA: (d)CMP kinase [Chlamydiales bacterium]|nr:(d)CMP kinase [Chlamydiales bacterium]